MNSIELVPERLGSPLPGRGAPLQLGVSVMIDAVAVGAGHVLDWQELFRTLRFSGEYFPFTAETGEPVDAGIHDPVIVERQGDIVSWEYSDPIASWGLTAPTLRGERSWKFAKFPAREYEDAILRAWWRACSLVRHEPAMRLLPANFTASRLLSLQRWLASEEAVPFQLQYVGTAPAKGWVTGEVDAA